MRVLYVMGQSKGGFPHYTAELANAMANRVDVIVLKPTDTTADELFDDDVEVVEAFTPLDVTMPRLYGMEINPVQLAKGFLSYRNIKRVREIDADVTHVTTSLFPHVKLFSILYGIDSVRPLVLTQHEVRTERFPLSELPLWPYYALDYAIPDVDADTVIVHTEKQRDVLVNRGRSREAVEVIPHGAYSVFGDYEDIDRSPEENCLLFFGNVVPPKGLDTLVEAIALARREVPDITLIIAGDGNLSARTESIIRRYPENFEVHNRFVPNEEVRELFARAQVAVMPYRDRDGTKGHSGSMLTSISFGTPVITSNAGDFPSQIAEWGCGTTVPADEPRKLVETIVDLLDDDEARAEMAVNSLRMAEALSWENVADQHMAVYERAIRRNRDLRTPEPVSRLRESFTSNS